LCKIAAEQGDIDAQKLLIMYKLSFDGLFRGENNIVEWFNNADLNESAKKLESLLLRYLSLKNDI
jgi:hypothetical protein